MDEFLERMSVLDQLWEIWTRGGKAIVTEQLCEHESGMCKMSNLWLSHDQVYSLSLKTKWILKTMKVRNYIRGWDIVSVV